ncbi:hypothetical protein OAE79_02345 [Rhodopirellula sp.]|nr:hypothetical protein [Rhodopirellula sp.]MDB4679157.1 hypothetical protein [Rhodopirellula sp.]
MGDPVGACQHVRNVLKGVGTFMLVEPAAGDTLEENLHALGMIYDTFSTLVGVPSSCAQKAGLAPGSQAGQKRLTQVPQQGGFGHVRRSAETSTRWCQRLTWRDRQVRRRAKHGSSGRLLNNEKYWSVSILK